MSRGSLLFPVLVVALLFGALVGNAVVPLSPWTWLIIWIVVFGYDCARMVASYRSWQTLSDNNDLFVVVPFVGLVRARTAALCSLMLFVMMAGVALWLVGSYASDLVAA